MLLQYINTRLRRVQGYYLFSPENTIVAVFRVIFTFNARFRRYKHCKHFTCNEFGRNSSSGNSRTLGNKAVTDGEPKCVVLDAHPKISRAISVRQSCHAERE